MEKAVQFAIVEDRQEDRFFLNLALLESFPGCKILEFSYAEDALAFLRSPERPRLDAIFVDINMPRMNGFEFVDEYQQLYPELRGETRIILTSSSINPDDWTRADSHPGINGCLEKPVRPDALHALRAA